MRSIKRTVALLVAATIISVCPLSVEAVSLKTENGIKYIQNDSGEKTVYTGWVKNKATGKRYYYKNGVMKKSCWLKSNGKRTYFLKKDGTSAVGKLTISGIEYEFDENGKLISDNWGVSITAKDVTATGLTIEALWDGTSNSGKIEFGSHFYLEYYKNGKWESVPYKNGVEEVAFTDEAYYFEANSPILQTKNWEYLYGELKNGRYRYCTPIMNFRGTGDYDIKTYYAYFTLE